MTGIFEKYEPDMNKSAWEKLDDIRNREMSQMDFLCKAVARQGLLLEKLYDRYGKRGDESENSDN